MEVPTPRPLYFWLSFIALVVGMITNATFGYLNYSERAEMRAEARMTRQMLNARGQVQLILVDAAKSGRPLTQEEIRTIDRLFVPAEYNLVESK